MTDEAIPGKTMNKYKLIILSGPSCVGKTPLIKAFNKLYPERGAKLNKIVLYNSRSPRPAEKEGVDYYFKERNEIESFRNNANFIVMEVRGDLQALDVNELIQQLNKSDVFYEGNSYIAKILLQHPLLKNRNKLSIFLSPFSKDEVLQLKSNLGERGFEDYVFDTMKTKLLRRAKKYKQELTKSVLENIDKRAADAFLELKDAWIYDFVIPNHDGEDSKIWEEPISINSNAYLSITEFFLLLNNLNKKISEKWVKEVFKY